MNDLLTDPKAWALGLLALLGGIVTWLFKRELTRIDEAIKDSVRRSEFEQMRTDLRHEHQENTDRLDRIEVATTRTHERIDDLYRDLMGKG